MISVQEVVTDPDLIAPKSYTVLRSTGQFVLGGFTSVTTSIAVFGPVQQATNREIEMLPEADRVGSIRAFWWTQPFYLTRGTAPVPSVHGETPQGSGTNYTLSSAPPDNTATVYTAGLQAAPASYTIQGQQLTFFATPTQPLYITWPVTVNVGQDASDILVYENEQYRVLSRYFDPGSGYWKALGTRLNAA